MSTKSRLILVVAILCCGCGGGSTDEHEKKSEIPEDCMADVDLILLLDGSSSVGTKNFQLVKKWVRELAVGMHIGHGHIQIGVVQYSYYYPRRPLTRQKYLHTHIQLGEFMNKTLFDQAVDNITYQGYQTFTAHAINKTLNVDFQSAKNRYPEAKRVLVLLTDGKATDAKYLQGVVDYAKTLGVLIYGVGVGEYDINELRLITDNQPDRVFEIQNFDDLTHIIKDLQYQVQSACDCNADGSISNKCDPCSRACLCRRNVIGRRCDKCAPGFYNFGHAEGCSECDCDPVGSNDTSACGTSDGQCQCGSDNFAGRRCDRCAKGSFGFPECRPCQCNGFADMCDQVSGVCHHCRAGRVGKHCEGCRPGHYWNAEKEKCSKCHCHNNINASDPHACNQETGVCQKCLHNTEGKHCEKCAKFYHGSAPKKTCRKCECSINGTDPATCEGNQCACGHDGRCRCLANVRGKTCSHCAHNTWGLAQGKGCIRCACNANGTVNTTTCDKKTGQCSCKQGFDGLSCDKCAQGLKSVGGDCVAFDDLEGDEGQHISTAVDNTTTTSAATTATTATTSTTTTTTTSASTTRTTTLKTTTRRTYPTQKVTRPRINPGWSHCKFCGGRQTWPSYCHGWMCRRRWPYHYQRPSPVRCYSGNWGCRSSVNAYYGQAYPSYGQAYPSYYRQVYPTYRSRFYGGYYRTSPSYYRGYYHHRRNSQPYRPQTLRLKLYSNKK